MSLSDHSFHPAKLQFERAATYKTDGVQNALGKLFIKQGA
jgi:hypothetical protein